MGAYREQNSARGLGWWPIPYLMVYLFFMMSEVFVRKRYAL
jgi:hypothetical protein